MDDELKIVLRSVLEADEQESAQRITSQLPNIERLVNGKSSIKIGVELASGDVKTQAQTMTKQMSSALAAHKVGVKLTPALDKESVGKLRSELEDLKVDPKITSAVTAELDKMEIRIDRISGSWSKVADNQRALLNLTIQGTDAQNRSVTYLQTYNTETGEIETRLTNIITDFERIRREEQQSTKAVDAKNAYLSKQRSLLKDIEASYSGGTSTRPVLDGGHLKELGDKYRSVEAAINEVASASGKMTDVQKAHIESLVADLRRAVKEYQNVEYVATSLRTKTGIQVNAEEVKALDAYEESLRSAGILTDGFAKGIAGLRSKLSTAFDRESLNAYLNSFGKLKSAVELFEQQIAGADSVYDKLIKKNNEISALNKRMLGMDKSSEEYESSTAKLEILKQEQAVLLGQAAAYDRIKGYSSSAQEEERQREILLANIAIEQAKIKDLAAAINNEMEIMPSVIKNVEARFGQLSVPTAKLKQRVESLNALMRSVSNAEDEEEKILAYQRLEDAIALCNREISMLSNTQNIGLRDEKLTIALDKAKSDLATVSRQWSAFKNNASLKREFADLEAGLNRVKNGADMSKWTAQFNAFKSQVKAAGLNIQSFGDTLKNNLQKVGQWLSATSIIFKAFDYLKRGLRTVVALDTALIDLRKTTDATEREYEEFYKTANKTAKQLGATTEEVIAQTAEWSRLGYTLQEASELAKNSAIFSSISEDLDLEAATDGLISIIKAFDVDVEDTMDGIISKVNAVGNAFAVTNSDIVEALTRSSSAMAAANNTFDETVSLATAA